MKVIKSIEIKNSPFFTDPIKIEFDDNLNCIMGGRGTGKSTLLFMLQSALEDSTEYDKVVYDVLKANLGDGMIVVNIKDDEGNNYQIEKTFNDEPQPYKMPSRQHVPISNIINDIKCDIYSTAKLEKIGLIGQDRLELIDKLIPEKIIDLYRKIDSKRIELDANANSIKVEYSKVQLHQNNVDIYSDVENTFIEHKKNKPRDLKEDENKKFESADKEEKQRREEIRFIDSVNENIEYLINHTNELFEEFDGLIMMHSKQNNFLNEDIMKPFIADNIKNINSVKELKKSHLSLLNNILESIGLTRKKLTAIHATQQNEFIKLKQTFDEHKSYINDYNDLSKKVDEKNANIKKLKDAQDKYNKIVQTRNSIVEKYNEIKKEIYNERFSSIETLNKKFGEAIRITLTFGGITDEYESLLREALKGTGMRYNILIPKIIRNISPDKLASYINNNDTESLKLIAGIDESRSKALIDALIGTDKLFEIESLYTADLPEFWLRLEKLEEGTEIKRDNYHSTDQLSTGQRCTTVLPIVFSVSNNPLIIDQPEDNLDNKYITQTIRKHIENLKGKRQLIFITHNPNIPVLADSEQNIFLDYFNKKSSILKDGSVNDVKECILTLLEGGADAFKRRAALYDEE